MASPSESLDFFLSKGLGTLYPEVVTALALFLTVPDTISQLPLLNDRSASESSLKTI